MIWLETLIELKFLNSSFSSFSLIEIRQTILCRAIRADGVSINSILPPLLHSQSDDMETRGFDPHPLPLTPHPSPLTPHPSPLTKIVPLNPIKVNHWNTANLPTRADSHPRVVNFFQTKGSPHISRPGLLARGIRNEICTGKPFLLIYKKTFDIQRILQSTWRSFDVPGNPFIIHNPSIYK